MDRDGRIFKSEANISNEIWIALSKAGCTLWRNNVGAWKDPKTGRLIRYGVGGKGGSDLLGIAPDGKFLAIECKTSDGRIRDEQNGFIYAVLAKGGRAGVARSVDDALKIALDPR